MSKVKTITMSKLLFRMASTMFRYMRTSDNEREVTEFRLWKDGTYTYVNINGMKHQVIGEL